MAFHPIRSKIGPRETGAIEKKIPKKRKGELQFEEVVTPKTFGYKEKL